MSHNMCSSNIHALKYFTHMVKIECIAFSPQFSPYGRTRDFHMLRY
ncbi:MAG: hypothetical protein JRI53_06540 [Deltaproteobacteria bacterium]|nr:hypothetical protein [Deltaproteobacteria bacterium]MBW1984362.1 hypothetical protein [Deltaproteobacteria bacterium]